MIETFFIFIGHSRSGHSLVGALLDAHENVCCSFHTHPLKRIRSHHGKKSLIRRAIFREIRESSRINVKRTESYDFQVPGLWQGKDENITAIGDKAGRGSVKELIRTSRGKQFPLFDKLRRIVGVPVKVIHITRNPYNNITTMFKNVSKSGSTIKKTFDAYFGVCKDVKKIRKYLQSQGVQILTIRHENFVGSPKDGLTRLCEFLGVACDGVYLEKCSSFVFDKPTSRFKKAEWNDKLLESAKEHIKRYEFLEGYDVPA